MDSDYFAKLTLPLQYKQYSWLFTDWAKLDHAIMYVQFISGVTIWQSVLKRVVNTSNFHGNSVNKLMCLEQRENVFVLILELY